MKIIYIPVAIIQKLYGIVLYDFPRSHERRLALFVRNWSEVGGYAMSYTGRHIVRNLVRKLGKNLYCIPYHTP